MSINQQPSTADSAFLKKKQHQLFIDNAWVTPASTETIACIDPGNGEIFSSISCAQTQDIDKAVAAARSALDSNLWSDMTPAARGELLWRLADLVQEHIEELSILETRDQGKPYSVSRFAEIPGVIKQLRFFAGAASKIEGSTVPTSISHQPKGKRIFAYTSKEPLGVIAAIVPWNSPLLLLIMKIAPALAAGCTLVIKPAEDTSLTALRLAELSITAGFPAGVINVITGHGAITGQALAAHPGIDKVAFTGSTQTGRLIVDAAKSNLKKVSLELGGKSPVVMLADADLEYAIPAAANAIFFNSGQVCVAGSRLYAHRSIFDQVVEGICEIGKKLNIAHGLEENSEIGPLVSAKQLRNVSQFIERAQAAGARVLIGGKPLDRPGFFMPPTVITEVQPDMEIVREEVFGPVLVCQPFDEVDEVVSMANDSKYGLAASVWTESLSMAHRLSQDVRAGTVWINCHYMFDPSLPIGGMKESGWGRDNGMQALDNYLELKTVVAAL